MSYEDRARDPFRILWASNPRGKGFEEPYPAEELKEKREHRMKFIEIYHDYYKHLQTYILIADQNQYVKI